MRPAVEAGPDPDAKAIVRQRPVPVWVRSSDALARNRWHEAVAPIEACGTWRIGAKSAIATAARADTGILTAESWRATR
jgi:hypothetical protein